MFSQIIKLIRVLGSETSPMQISVGFALGMVAGFAPLMSVHNVLVLFCLLIFRVNIASFIIVLPLFSLLAYILDPIFHQVGLVILSQESLISTWTDMYNSGFWRITGFNNTIVMGGLAVSLVAFIPVVILFNFLVKRYRTHVYAVLKQSRLFKFFQSSKLFSRVVSVAE